MISENILHQLVISAQELLRDIYIIVFVMLEKLIDTLNKGAQLGGQDTIRLLTKPLLFTTKGKNT